MNIITTRPLENTNFNVDILPHNKIENPQETFVGFDLNMERKVGSYIYEFFVPCFLMVVSSWISFAVSPEVVPGRLGLLLTLFLMLVNMSSSVSQVSRNYLIFAVVFTLKSSCEQSEIH